MKNNILKSKSKITSFLGIPLVVGASIFAMNTSPTPVNSWEPYSSLNIPSVDNTIGIDYNSYDVVYDTVHADDRYGDILTKHNISYASILESVEKSKGIFDVEHKLMVNRPYQLLRNKKSRLIEAMVYEPNALEVVVLQFQPEVSTQIIQKPVDTVLASATGYIESSLWNAIMNNNLADNHTANLAMRMEDAFAWTVDFHHLQQGDKFKLIFEKLYVQGELVAVGNLRAAHFNASKEDFYAINYKSEEYDGFFDLDGKTMKRGFLKAPVKYSRISSRFSPKRFHPVLKRYKSHLGTDFAAPHGTPILATMDGTITKRGRTKGNGNYVKIKHDDTYSTQYLHMSRFASGQQVGSHVRQGEVIGYVGSTGYATGPHVCYRFWKNGKQVDALKLNFPAPTPMSEEEMPSYLVVRDKYKAELDRITFDRENADAIAHKDATEDKPTSNTRKKYHTGLQGTP